MPERASAVMVLGLRAQEQEVDRYIQSLGYKMILLNNSISLEDALSVDLPVEIDLNDEEQVLAKAVSLSQQFAIKAVCTLNEYRVPLVARINHALGLSHGIAYEAALNCRNKKRTRRCLAEHQVGSAAYAIVRSPAEALAATAHLPLPVVVKPSNDAGSNLVARCDTLEEVWAAVEAIQREGINWVGQAIDPEILMEEYLEGPEFSVESCTVDGRTMVLAITAKLVTPPPLAVEVGHTVPAQLPEEEAEAIRRLTIDALAALGVDSAVTHTEVKLTPRGPRIIEINARPGGDKIPVLVRAVTGYDLRELVVHIALGGTLEDAPRHQGLAPSAAVRFFVAERAGTVEMAAPRPVARMPGVESLDLSVSFGDAVVPTSSNYTRLGHIIVRGSEEQGADAVAEQALTKLALQVV